MHRRVIGIDSDESMLAAAGRMPAMPQLSFVRADAIDRIVELLNELAARYSIPMLPQFPDPVHALDLLEVTG